VTKTRIISTHLLAVEGKDECNFFDVLLKHENIKDVQIIDIGGKDKFRVEIPFLINAEGFSDVQSLGFIRDAEENQANSAFSSICSILKNNKNYKLPIPKNMNEVIYEQNNKVGVFIMPNNSDRGMLEDLCLESIKINNPIYNCVNKYIDCCLDFSENKNINKSKARVQTYLAGKKPIVNSLGLAAQKGHWNFSSQCFSDIKLFLHNLSND